MKRKADLKIAQEALDAKLKEAAVKFVNANKDKLMEDKVKKPKKKISAKEKKDISMTKVKNFCNKVIVCTQK